MEFDLHNPCLINVMQKHMLNTSIRESAVCQKMCPLSPDWLTELACCDTVLYYNHCLWYWNPLISICGELWTCFINAVTVSVFLPPAETKPLWIKDSLILLVFIKAKKRWLLKAYTFEVIYCMWWPHQSTNVTTWNLWQHNHWKFIHFLIFRIFPLADHNWQSWEKHDEIVCCLSKTLVLDYKI